MVEAIGKGAVVFDQDQCFAHSSQGALKVVVIACDAAEPEATTGPRQLVEAAARSAVGAQFQVVGEGAVKLTSMVALVGPLYLDGVGFVSLG